MTSGTVTRPDEQSPATRRFLGRLIGASSLIDIFVGAPVVGYLTDRFGRAGCS